MAVPLEERVTVEQVWTARATLLTDAASETAPTKLEVLVRLTESVPDAPESKLDGVITEMAKSPTSTMNDTECEDVPSELEPVTLRL